MIIALTEKYNPTIHGSTEMSSQDLPGHRLALVTYDPVEFARGMTTADADCELLSRNRHLPWSHTSEIGPRLELAIVKRLEGNEDIAIRNTISCPITLFQRTWRKHAHLKRRLNT